MYRAHTLPHPDRPSTASRVSRLVGTSHRRDGWIEALATEGAENPEGTAQACVAVPGQSEARRLLEAARAVRQEFGRQRQVRHMRRAGWAGLALLALSPIAALAFPEHTVTAYPATIRIYQAMGQEVNAYGLAIRGVEAQRLVIDGHSMIAVKGEIINTSAAERRVPMLRLGLRAKHNDEVHHWIHDSEAPLLAPGQKTSFATRLPSPPEAGRNLEIRFARADEIGSNTAP